MTERLDQSGGGAEKRRSTRVMHSASITIRGTDTLGKSFCESTRTVMVNCYGCQYQGIRYPAPNSSIMLEVSRVKLRRSPRMVPARVIWVRRPQAYRTLYHVGIEFEVPGNVWDIALPPADWFPCPEDEELVIPVSSEENIAHPNQFVLNASMADTKNSGSSSDEALKGLVSSASACSTETLLLPEERPVVAAQVNPAASVADGPASILEMVRMFTAEAVAQEIVRIREFIDAELQTAIDKAFDRLSDRAAASLAPPALRHAATENPGSLETLSDTAGEMSGGSESAEARAGQSAPADVALNARQRRAAKRARKTQKSSP